MSAEGGRHGVKDEITDTLDKMMGHGMTDNPCGDDDSGAIESRDIEMFERLFGKAEPELAGGEVVFGCVGKPPPPEDESAPSTH